MLEELILAELCAGYGFTPEYVLQGGYFKAHRLWDMLCEAKANDLFELAIASGVSTMNDVGRKSIFDHLKMRQPRRHPQEQKAIMPPEVWEKFRENFEKAGNVEQWLTTKNLLSR